MTVLVLTRTQVQKHINTPCPPPTTAGLGRIESLSAGYAEVWAMSCCCIYVWVRAYHSQPVAHIPLRELLLHAFELVLHVERDAVQYKTWGGREGRRGLLASCRLNKSRVKEMEREAIFTDNLLFFMGWIRTVWTKGVGDQQWARTREKRQEQRGNVWQRSAFKDTVSRIYMRAGCTHWVWWVLAGWFPSKVWCSQLVKEAPGTTGIWAKGDTQEQNEAWADELAWGGQRLSEQREKTASEEWFANPQKQTHTQLPIHMCTVGVRLLCFRESQTWEHIHS